MTTRPNSSPSTLSKLLFQAILLTASTSNSYAKPEACPTDNSVTGYSSLAVLNQAMLDDAKAAYAGGKFYGETEYVYTLCPNTVYDLNENGGETKAIIPINDNTVVKCGNDGSSANNCVLDGGNYQVFFYPGMDTPNAQFQGLTLKNSKRTSVGGWGKPSSSVTFTDCHWESHNNDQVVEQIYSPETYCIYNCGRERKLDAADEPRSAMSVTFDSCTFKGNTVAESVIQSSGGSLTLEKCTFDSNTSNDAVISVESHTDLVLNSNLFSNNEVGVGTVMVSGDAIVVQDYQNNVESVSASSEASGVCDGIYLVDSGICCTIDEASCP